MLMTDMKENETEDERIERIVRKVIEEEMTHKDFFTGVRYLTTVLVCSFLWFFLFVPDPVTGFWRQVGYAALLTLFAGMVCAFIDHFSRWGTGYKYGRTS